MLATQSIIVNSNQYSFEKCPLFAPFLLYNRRGSDKDEEDPDSVDIVNTEAFPVLVGKGATYAVNIVLYFLHSLGKRGGNSVMMISITTLINGAFSPLYV